MWPEDDVDFEEFDHEPMLGAPLTAAEIVAAQRARQSEALTGAEAAAINVPEERSRPRRRKQACDPPSVSPPDRMGELEKRQDLLAEAAVKSFDVISNRLGMLEARPKPLWSLNAWHKGCVIAVLVPALCFVGLFVLALIGQIVGRL